jgi:probable phosphoglycerate mutase
MKIYFVRHGESKANILREFSNWGWKHGLTPLGFKQAETLAENLRGISFIKIFSSPLKRAMETALALSHHLSVPIEITHALREFDTGINEGQRDPESWKRWEEVMADWMKRGLLDSRIEGGESLNDQLARFIPFLDKVLEFYSSKQHNIIMVGHGGFFYSVLPRVLKNIRYEDFYNLDFPNTGMVIAERTSHGLHCLEWCGRKFE